MISFSSLQSIDQAFTNNPYKTIEYNNRVLELIISLLKIDATYIGDLKE